MRTIFFTRNYNGQIYRDCVTILDDENLSEEQIIERQDQQFQNYVALMNRTDIPGSSADEGIMFATINDTLADLEHLLNLESLEQISAELDQLNGE